MPTERCVINILFEDLEETIKRKQEGWVIGNKKIWTITYAEDVAIAANDEKEMKGMIRTYKKYLKKKGLELNAEKIKIMEFSKAGGRRQNSFGKMKDDRNGEVI